MAADGLRPAQQRYRMPAEWEPHAATWLSWPRRKKTWPDRFEPIPAVWAHLARTLAQFEPVQICAGGEGVMAEARALVGDTPNVTLHTIETNDAWMRDHGPMFLVGPAKSRPLLVDWGFNAWGGKYEAWDKDDRVPGEIARLLGYDTVRPGIVLEGGAVDVNGIGTLLTTEECLLNPNRNPQLTRGDLEKYLVDYCSVRQIIWLGRGIVGDDTDGHIDELARFVGSRTVVAAYEDDPSDVNYAPLQDNWQRLQRAVDQDGRALDVLPLAMPGPVVVNGKRLPASYCNFYLCNGAVLVPQFDDPADAAALETLARLFPDRRAVPMPARDLVYGLGAYHCITQQQPRLPG
ncbi:MAG: agmatine deiminase family protein [Planctomycetes bacterium]|nr:agmatine deiminase family protein [Planctomycetota bacterium]